MELVFRILLFITGVINLIPFVLAFAPQKISDSYGITVPDVNYELLLRHRAVLFGIVGGLMMYAAISQKLYSVSVLIGLISMASFTVLYFVIGEINEELGKVMKIDLVGILLVTIGFAVYKLKA